MWRLRRLGALSFFGATSVGAILVACSSFSAADDPGAPADAALDAASEAESAPICDPGATGSDAKNCGACGHDCLGGPCNAGKCGPVQVGSSTDAPVLDVAVDATRVLWLTDTQVSAGVGQLYACPKSGCSGSPTVLVANKDPGALVSDGVTAYASFINSSRQIVRLESDGMSTKLLTPEHNAVMELAIRPEGLFYLAFQEPGGPGTTGSERSAYVWDKQKEVRAAVYTPPCCPNTEQMAVTQERIYLGAHNTGLIISCTKNDCSSWTTVSNDAQAYVVSMATDGQRIFWTNLSGSLLSCAADGTTPCAISTDLGPAQLGAAKAQTVTYVAGALYIATDTGDILSCKPNACASTVTTVVHQGQVDLSWILWDPLESTCRHASLSIL